MAKQHIHKKEDKEVQIGHMNGKNKHLFSRVRFLHLRRL